MRGAYLIAAALLLSGCTLRPLYGGGGAGYTDYPSLSAAA